MTKIRLSTIAAVALVGLCSVAAHAEDISTKKMTIKDNADSAKRQFRVQSADAGVALAEADDPGTNGVTIHAYSATDNMCVTLDGGMEWSTNGKVWKYKNKLTKNSAQIGDGKLSVKLKSGVDYSLLDDPSQGTVNVQVQFGDTGTRYCMQCPGGASQAVKDEDGKFIAKLCGSATCDFEPPGCGTTATTTTTTVPTTTTTMGPPGAELQGALPPTFGRFNFNLVIGVPGANAACNTNFAGTHACSITELQAAEAAGDLDGLTDINANTVTSFWAIDPLRPDDDQCTVSVAWDYQTQHTGQFADKVTLTNPTGDLGPITNLNLCSTQSWVGCCL